MIITGLIALILGTVTPDANASVAWIIGELTGAHSECPNKPDKNGVMLCSEKNTGDIYYMVGGVRYDTYPTEKEIKDGKAD